jgi:hypothetical protein
VQAWVPGELEDGGVELWQWADGLLWRWAGASDGSWERVVCGGALWTGDVC